MNRRKSIDKEIVFASGRGVLPVAKPRVPQLRGELKRLSGDHVRGICGMHYGGWNGGWTFYCACGFCTPLRTTFSDGLDLLESHWERTAEAKAKENAGVLRLPFDKLRVAQDDGQKLRGAARGVEIAAAAEKPPES